MTQPKVITRDHNFTNRIIRIEIGFLFLRIWREKSNAKLPFLIEVTNEGKQAFKNEDWDWFDAAIAYQESL